MKTVISGLVFAAIFAAFLALTALPASALAQSYDTLSTGAGKDNRRPYFQYSLKMIFAEKQGSYLGNIDVSIVDEAGNKVLDAHSTGPWFLVKLPPGAYRLIARRADGARAAADVTISPGRQKRVFLTW